MVTHTNEYWMLGIAGMLTVATVLWLKQKKPKYGFGPSMHSHPPHPPQVRPIPRMPEPYPMMRSGPATANTIYRPNKGVTGVKGPGNTDPWAIGPGPGKVLASKHYQYGNFCGCH